MEKRQTIYERAEVCERVITEIRKLLKDKPIEVIGHLELVSDCCSNGTVAIVKFDFDQVTQK